MLRFLVALLALVALVALPSAAVAQSAGDDQYSDPFGDSDGGQSNGDQGGGGDDTSGGDTGDTTGGDAPVSSDPGTTSAAPDTTASAPDGAESTGTLPHTGFEIVLLLAAAFPLVVGGVALRRIASGPYRP